MAVDPSEVDKSKEVASVFRRRDASVRKLYPYDYPFFFYDAPIQGDKKNLGPCVCLAEDEGFFLVMPPDASNRVVLMTEDEWTFACQAASLDPRGLLSISNKSVERLMSAICEKPIERQAHLLHLACDCEDKSLVSNAIARLIGVEHALDHLYAED